MINPETGEILDNPIVDIEAPIVGRYQPVDPEQLDRIEAKLDTLLAEKTIVVQETGEVIDDSLWPIWYSIANSVPGWKVTYEAADEWRVKTEISEELAELKAYALRDWFTTAKKGRDPYKTWQNWCRADRDKNPEKKLDRFASDYERRWGQ
jgi:hypothetical protein